MRGWAIAGLALLACEPRPAVLPDAYLEAVLPVDADRAVALLLAEDGKSAWLAQLDRDGHASWIRPLPDVFAGDMPGHGGDDEYFHTDGQHAVLRFTDPDVEPLREHRIAFSLADGTPRWHHAIQYDYESSGGSFRIDRGQVVSVEDHRLHGAHLTVFDLVTGTQQFTRRLRDSRHELGRRVLAFADVLALLDDERGVVLVRRSDGVVRATLRLVGPVCALGETLIGLRDDVAIAHDMSNLDAPPRVLGEGLADLIEHWSSAELRSCHRRGEDFTLQLYTGDTYLATLGAARREVTAFGSVHELALLPEIGDLVPEIRLEIPHRCALPAIGGDDESGDAIAAVMVRPQDRPYVVGTSAMVPGVPTQVRRIEPLIHDAGYRWIERFDGGYLLYGRDIKDHLLSLDARGEVVTGAAQVSGVPRWIGPEVLAAGHLWLIGDHTHAGSAPLRVLDARTLAPVGGDDFTILDRTQEAQAAWLPPRSAAAPVEPPPPVPRSPAAVRPDPNNLPFKPPPWDITPVYATLYALGHTGPFELLAWAPHTRSVLMVAYELDADGPRWTLVALRQRGDDVWDDDVHVSRRRPTRVLRRRPTHTDLEAHLRAIGLSTWLTVHEKNALRSSPIDARRYLELTGEPPRWRSRATQSASAGGSP